MKIVEYARERIHGFSFSTDIIIGFPGESNDDFSQTLALIKKVQYDNIFSFVYSKRSGTKAAEMLDPTSEEEKTDRIMILLKEQRVIATKMNSRFIGQTLRVLDETPSKKLPVNH